MNTIEKLPQPPAESAVSFNPEGKSLPDNHGSLEFTIRRTEGAETVRSALEKPSLTVAEVLNLP